ncbi:MAG TPA: prepilin-type N-terminal cleavage/methylation domain-containing protein [Conexibacter sp.]|nr:prepilin-type N-terminal cleavage/methylation domain-containing protein [Conexibacter sp.]
MSPLDLIARLCARLRRDERGFAMIEVLVSAVLLTLAATGVYLGLDGASQTSGINKHRSEATELAQQDQDRMRAMAVTELSNYRDTSDPPVQIGNVGYTISSSASWVTDSTGSASCTSGTAAAHYLRIASSVTWPGMQIPPVTIESVVAPPAGSFGTNLGSLAVQVRDHAGNPVQGATATLSGPQGYTDTTNAAGCVLWGYLPVGNYTVAVAKTGYVDPNGVAAPQQAVGVVGESTTTLAFDYDLGGRIQANYQTLTQSGGTAVAENATAFSAVTSHLTVPIGPFGDGAAHTAFLSDPVYPFSDPYGVYAGTCRGADPTQNGQSAQLAQVNPGGTTNVTVLEPPVDLRVVNNGTPVASAQVFMTGTGSGCGALPTQTTSTATNGYLPDRGVPYGPYNVCVLVLKSGSTYYKKTGTISNTSPRGVPVASATYDFNGVRTTGTCP